MVSVRVAPDAGDIVIRQESRADGVAFVLRTEPGADQFILRSREAAIAQATSVAVRQRVSVWFADGNQALTLISNYRVSTT